MHKIVIKIGGSNLKDVNGLERIISLAKAYHQPVIVVVSAFYGITDRLEAFSQQRGDVSGLLKHLRKIHISALEKFISDPQALKQSSTDIDTCLSALKKILLDQVEPQTSKTNVLLSYGEKLSARVIHFILKENGFPNRLAFPEEMGLISNRRFFQGSILLKKSSVNLQNYLKDDVSYVVPGFYALSELGETVLLGRGGSDYSAACIAHCVDATYLDVWKDVEGYLSADPKFVSNPAKIARLSYLEAAEISYFGAKILHPRTIQPLVSKGISVRLFNPVKHSSPENEATLITNQSDVSTKVIKSITYNANIALLKLRGSGVGIKKGILAEVTSALDKARINIRSVVTSQTAINFIFSRQDLKKAANIVGEISKTMDFEIEINDDIAWVAAIGQGVGQKEGIAAAMLTALAKAGINIQHIVFGASEVALYLIVKRACATRAVYLIHQEIFNHFVN